MQTLEGAIRENLVKIQCAVTQSHSTVTELCFSFRYSVQCCNPTSFIHRETGLKRLHILEILSVRLICFWPSYTNISMHIKGGAIHQSLSSGLT